MTSCCPKPSPSSEAIDHCHTAEKKFDWLLYGSLSIIVAGFIVHFAGINIPYVTDFSDAVVALMKTMWWGLALGIIAVGIMNKVPREYFAHFLGRGDTVGGIGRAIIAGLFLDLCSHGILMVGAKLYERGASLPQLMAFLIASPWNSLSLTFILIALIGLPWTLVFIAASALVAFVTGLIFLHLTKRGLLPANPHTLAPPSANFDLRGDMKVRLKSAKFRPFMLVEIIRDGLVEGRMVMRWLFFGAIIASLIAAFVSTHILATYFGPTMIGLLLTLLAATVIEVCSEGSTPIGAELVNRAAAPGNGFAFLMAGVSTDYTELMVLRAITKSWKIALCLPLFTVPQIVLLGYIMNQFS